MKLGQRYFIIVVYMFLTCITLVCFFMWHFMPDVLFKNKKDLRTTHVAKTAIEFRKHSDWKTGNPLIDNYGKNDLSRDGEYGKGLLPPNETNVLEKGLFDQNRINVMASDRIPLNRMVPDSRFKRCSNITYDDDLPTASIIIPFYNEWPSILLRTVYSIINRTPRHLLWEILLIDDFSDNEDLKALSEYVDTHFPLGLVKIIRLSERVGLIKARQLGFHKSTGDVIVFFDSHMEVNIDWLQPLLSLIKADRKTLALGTLDYIKATTLKYEIYFDYLTRYGFNWRMVFFETYFRPDNFGPDFATPKRGVVMVGTGYAVDRKYFAEIGGFDDNMRIWGGENIELAWRIWMCGGQVIHAPCSKIGHISREQPYKFPEGRKKTEMFNYKRAVEVWMEPQHKKFVFDSIPGIKDIDAGDLSERLALKRKLQCKSFTWFLDNIWPELFVYDRHVFAWGSARNPSTNLCLDNKYYLFQAAEPLSASHCHYKFSSQGFSWTTDRTLRTTLHCVVLKMNQPKERPLIQSCLVDSPDIWIHVKNGFLKHERSGLCLDLDSSGPVMNICQSESSTQKWNFNTYNF